MSFGAVLLPEAYGKAADADGAPRNRKTAALIITVYYTKAKKSRDLRKNAAKPIIRRTVTQHALVIVVRLQSQIFRQIAQKFLRHTDVFQEISVQDYGKDASKRAAKV